MDPSQPPGITAPIGALLLRSGTTQWWQKFGATDTQWRLVTMLQPNNFDAFGRLRVGEPTTVFDAKQNRDDLPLLFNNAQVAGAGGSATYNANRASTTLAVSNLTAGTMARQTFRRFNYQPGRSQFFALTVVLGAGVVGVRRRVGSFDPSNGLFFQLDGLTLGVVQRSFVTGVAVDTVVAQAAWNLDPLNGAGPSGITLDLATAQICVFDMQWLGVGRVRFGFDLDGQIVYCHEFNNANNLPAVYMSTPNLPIRYEITNDGTGPAAELECICASVQSEGGFEPTGITRSCDRGVAGFVTTNTNTLVFPVLSLRLQAGSADQSTIQFLLLNVLSTTNPDARWALYLNPTIAGVDAAAWVAIASSAVEFDVTRNNTNTLTGGTLIASGYISDASDAISQPLGGANPLPLGVSLTGVRDQLVVGVQNFTNTVETYFASATFLEVR